MALSQKRQGNSGGDRHLPRRSRDRPPANRNVRPGCFRRQGSHSKPVGQDCWEAEIASAASGYLRSSSAFAHPALSLQFCVNPRPLPSLVQHLTSGPHSSPSLFSFLCLSFSCFSRRSLGPIRVYFAKIALPSSFLYRVPSALLTRTWRSYSLPRCSPQSLPIVRHISVPPLRIMSSSDEDTPLVKANGRSSGESSLWPLFRLSRRPFLHHVTLFSANLFLSV